jgi:hypothetical protein
MQIETLDRMMDAWEEQIKSPDPMTASSATGCREYTEAATAAVAPQKVTGTIAVEIVLSDNRPRGGDGGVQTRLPYPRA